MPNTKKIFQIEINGLTESVNAAKSLNSQLDGLEERINRLQNAKVEVKVSGNTNETTDTRATVSGNKGTTNASKRLTEEQRLQNQIAKEQQRNEALLTQEYQNQLAALTRIKNENKEITKDIAQQTSGVKDMNGEYANTLAGQRAYLSELKSQLANVELGTDEWERLGQEVLRVNTNVKQLEESYGVFTRNVGNYASAAKGFKELADGTKEYENTINGLTAKLNDLDDTMRNLEVGSEQYRQAQNEIRDLQGQLRELQAGAESAGNAMEEKLGVRFTTVINGITYTFDDVNQGIGLLEDKLYSMAQAGDTTSKEFRAIQQEIARLRSSVISVDSAIDQMIGTSKGLRNITSLFTGFTGIASLGQGLQGLFGGQNADLDESIQKFTSLTMVLQGLMAIQQQMAQEDTAFTRTLRTVNDRINGVLSGFDSYIQKVTAARDISRDFEGSISDYFGEAFMNILDVVDKAGSEISTKFENILETLGKLPQNKKLSLTELFTLDDDALRSKYNDMKKDFGDMLVDFRKEAKNANIFEELQAATDNWINSINTVGKMNGFTRWLSSGTIAAKAFAVAIRGVTIALQALSKALIITALIQALMWAIEKVTQAIGSVVGKIKQWTGDTGDLIDSSNLVQGTLERQREEWERLSEAVDKARESTGKYKTEMDAFKKSINEAGKQLKDFVIGVDRMEQLSENLDEGMGFFSTGKFGGVDSVEEFRKEYENLMKVVQQGQDRFRGKGFGGFWNTQEDAMEDLASAQKAVIKDFMYQINQIDFKKPEEAVKRFRKLVDDEMYASALANIEELFPEEEWAKNLKLMVEHYEEAIDMMKDKDDELVESAKETAEEVARQIRDINTYNLQFQPGQWRFGYERQLLKDQYEDERKAAEGNAELLAAIDKKYYNDRQALIRKQAQEIKQINFQIQEDNLAAQKDGLDKEIAQLNLAREQEINAAKQTDINVNEQILAINKNYDAQILKLKKDFYKRQVDAAEERNKQLLEQERQFLEQDLQMQRQISQLQNANNMQGFENENHDITSTITYDVNVTGGDGLNERKAYYDKLLRLQKDYIDKKEQMDIEAAKQQTNYDLEDSEKQYQDQLKSLDDFYKRQKDLMDENLDQGLISQEEYNTEMAALTQQLADQEAKLQENANARQIAIVQRGENEQTRIMQEANDARVEANNEYLKQMTDNLDHYYDEIDSKMRSTSKANTNSLGIINYKKEKENLQNTQEEYQNLLSNIDKEYSSLQGKLVNNEISFNDFTQAKEELDSLRQKTEENVKATQKALDNLVNTVAGSVLNMINGYMSALGDIWNMVAELRSNSLDAEEKRLERQQEILDEELEAIEEAYEAQEEVTRQHRDKINDIEGELSTARGDRRQALIDQLAKERDAELKSLQTEQDIQKKKQANEKKQQALEKQKEALEKKRWEQNKQNSVVQATINTFTAVTNALAVQPWFVGLALSATALALGMANVAKISAQKYMADGGLLNGKSHAQGGIPVGTTGIEVEGNEYVINKNTTMKNLPLLEYINSQRRPLTKEDLVNFYDDKKGNRLITKSIGKFADGGQLPSGVTQTDLRRLINYQQEEDTRPIVVSVVDIVNATDDLREVQALSGLVND
jgi:chromosome segregation ATPase